MIAAVLSAAGYRTGLFTSPHLDRVEERIAHRRPALLGRRMIGPTEWGTSGRRSRRWTPRRRPDRSATGGRRPTSRSSRRWPCATSWPSGSMRPCWKWGWAAGSIRPTSARPWCRSSPASASTTPSSWATRWRPSPRKGGHHQAGRAGRQRRDGPRSRAR